MSLMSWPGFLASSAAATRRTRSITRLRLGAPGLAKFRLRCSRLRPTVFASVVVVTGRPECATTTSHALRCNGVVSPRDWGGSCKAWRNRVEKACGNTRSRAALSSIPSTMKSMNPRAAHRATAGVSEGRSGRIPKNGALGNSAANAAAFHISSSGEPRSTSAASTSTRRNTDSSSSADRVEMIFQRRLGNADRTRARARSRSKWTTSVGIAELSAAATLDPGFHCIKVRLSFDELPDQGIVRVLDLVDCADLPHLSFIQHRYP
ncbi:MAG: hypothetical protein QOH22_1286 [Gemmatimonadaceae bacterium]|nr:hypothetical protein [Gemmatimonadaceae bacterium]